MADTIIGKELAEYKKYLGEQGLASDEADQYLKYLEEQGQVKLEQPEQRTIYTPRGPVYLPREGGDNQALGDLKKAPKQLLELAGKGATKGLDYLSGIARVAAGGYSSILPALRDKPTYIQQGDVMKALKGEAPRLDTMLERAGWGEGKKMSEVMPALYSETGAGPALQKGGSFDPTQRQVVGFVGEAALDPLNLVGAGLTKKATTPIAAGLKEGGEAVYKSTFKNIAKHIPEEKADKLASVMLEKGAKGRMKTMQKAAESIKHEAVKKADNIVDTAQNANVKVPTKEVFNPAIEAIEKLKKSGNPDDAIAAIRSRKKLLEHMKGTQERINPGKWGNVVEQAGKDAPLDEYFKHMDSSIPVRDSQELKKRIHKHLSNYYKKGTRTNTKDMVSDVEAALATGHRSGIEKNIGKEIPELAGKLKAENKVSSAIYDAETHLAREMRKETTKNIISPVKGWVAGRAMQHPIEAAGYALGEIATMPAVRSYGGLGAKAVGEMTYGVPDIIARRGAWDYLRDKPKGEEQ